jgi:hypothetical protein
MGRTQVVEDIDFRMTQVVEDIDFRMSCQVGLNQLSPRGFQSKILS